MNYKLDNKDKKILYELDLNARQSFREIGKKVRLSKEVVNYRIRNMEKLGVIKGYYSIINMSRLGYMCNRLFIKFRNLGPKKEKEIIDFYCKNKKYWWVVSSNAHIDLGLGTWEKDLYGFKKSRDELTSNFGEYILDFSHCTYLGFYIYRRAYLGNKKIKETKQINYLTNKIDAVDDIDLQILKLIAGNARLPTINIAKELKLNIQTVSQRLKRLIDLKIIEAFRPMINLESIGLYWYKLFFTLKNYAKKKELLDFCSLHPNIVYAYETTNREDLEIELEVESYEQFKQILDDLRTKFEDTIESYKYLVWYKENKVKFFEE
jgi:Lrp/AsnC family leucine-responsive transcriptional regulator